jgi:hypothetical protein
MCNNNPRLCLHLSTLICLYPSSTLRCICIHHNRPHNETMLQQPQDSTLICLFPSTLICLYPSHAVLVTASERAGKNRACLVLSVGSVIAGPLVVGPSVELLCCSTSGSWDSNTPLFHTTLRTDDINVHFISFLLLSSCS